MASAPPAETLAQIMDMLRAALSPDTALQRAAYTTLEALRSQPAFAQYLAFILAHGADLPPEVRALAGLTVKGVLEASYSRLPVDARASVRADVARVLGDAQVQIQRTAANLVAAIVQREGLAGWPELPGMLAALLRSGVGVCVTGGLRCLAMLADDCAEEFDDERLGNPLDVIVPVCIVLMRTGETIEIRRFAAEIVRRFVYTGAAATVTHLNDYYAALVELSTAPDALLRGIVCESLTTLLECRQAVVWPRIREMCAHQLACSALSDPTVARPALQFWRALCDVVRPLVVDKPEYAAVIHDILPELLRLCVRLVELSDADLRERIAEAMRPDYNVPDRLEHVAPQFLSSLRASRAGAATGAEDDADDADDDGDDDDGLNFVGATSEVTIRDAAGRALEDLADVYTDRAAAIVLPEVLHRLSVDGTPEQVVRARECGLLVLGAVFDGCRDSLDDYMPQLFPFVLSCCTNSYPCIRKAAIWTIGEMSSWIHQSTEELLAVGENIMSTPVAQALTMYAACLLDPFKAIQKQALAADQDVQQAGTQSLPPELTAILLSTYIRCLQSYQLGNRLTLCENIACLISTSPHVTQSAEFPVLVNLLWSRYQEVPDASPEVDGVAHCLTSVLQTRPEILTGQCSMLCLRAIKMLEHEIVLLAAASDTLERGAAENSDRLVTLIDMVDVVLAYVKDAFRDIVTSTNVIELALSVVQLASSEPVRAALAFFGDLIIHCLPAAAGHLHAILPAALKRIQYPSADAHVLQAYSEAVANGIWIMLEATPRIDAALLLPMVPEYLDRLARVMARRQYNRLVLSNCAVALGRLTVVLRASVAERFQELLTDWARGLTLTLENEDDARDAYLGFSMCVQSVPAVAVRFAAHVLVAFASWHAKRASLPPPALLLEMRNAVATMQSSMTPHQHRAAYEQLEAVAVQHLQAMFAS